MSISALKGLYKDMHKMGAAYLLTSRLNQDSLESFFSLIRGLGRFYDNPIPNEVKKSN